MWWTQNACLVCTVDFACLYAFLRYAPHSTQLSRMQCDCSYGWMAACLKKPWYLIPSIDAWLINLWSVSIPHQTLYILGGNELFSIYAWINSHNSLPSWNSSSQPQHFVVWLVASSVDDELMREFTMVAYLALQYFHWFNYNHTVRAVWGSFIQMLVLRQVSSRW